MRHLRKFLDSNNSFALMAGPCSVESEHQMRDILEHPSIGALVRGGIFKMRTRPDTFQGLGESGIEIIKELKKEFDFDFITEISDPRQLEVLDSVTDMYQIGTRNMYNYELLKEINKYEKPVLLKRGFSATIDEWLGAASYFSNLKNNEIILCERGVRSFDNKLRNMLDLGSVIYLKKNSPYKVVVDPSHSMGHAKYVREASYAALCAGADGLLIETHPTPQAALSDKDQALSLEEFQELSNTVKELLSVFNKELFTHNQDLLGKNNKELYTNA